MSRLQTLAGFLTGFLLIIPGSLMAQRGSAGGRAMPAGTPVLRASPAVQRLETRGMASRTVIHAAPQRSMAHAVRRGTPVSRVRSGAAAAQNFHVNNFGNPGAAFNNFPSQTPIVVPGDFTPVPGLGFDMPHLAATQGPNAVGAGNVIHTGGNSLGVIFPFFGGGYYEPDVEPPSEEAQPAVDEQSGVSAETIASEAQRAQLERDLAIVSQSLGNSGALSRPAPQTPASAAAVEPETPLREASEYVFVRRDGGLVFAVAYSWESGTLRYITRDGFRRSIDVGVLDLDATRQFNEQRGLSFRAPA